MRTEASGTGVIDTTLRFQQIDVTDVVKWQLANDNHGMILVGENNMVDLMIDTQEKNTYHSAVLVFELDVGEEVSADVLRPSGVAHDEHIRGSLAGFHLQVVDPALVIDRQVGGGERFFFSVQCTHVHIP